MLGASPFLGHSQHPPRPPQLQDSHLMMPGSPRPLPGCPRQGRSALLGVSRALRARAWPQPTPTSGWFGPLALAVPGWHRAATAGTAGTAPAPALPLRDPPGRSREPSKHVLTLPQEQPPGSPRLSAAPSLQLVPSAGFLLPRYGFGFNNS